MKCLAFYRLWGQLWDPGGSTVLCSWCCSVQWRGKLWGFTLVRFRCFSIKRFPRRGYEGPAYPACIDFPSIETQSKSYILSRWCPAFALFWPASLAAESRVNHLLEWASGGTKIAHKMDQPWLTRIKMTQHSQHSQHSQHALVCEDRNHAPALLPCFLFT